LAGLSEEKCVACSGKEPALTAEEITRYKPEVPEWQLLSVEGEPRLQRVFRFKDFKEALQFTDKIGALAEQEDHHPAILTEWGKVTISWWTHKIKGLHKNDFIMASKTDALYGK
jgi:4a-hydroxytetrahydrobiopterin dehydratase